MKRERLINIKPSGANFILENFLPIPKNAVTLLSASGGTGKTRLSLVMADRHIQKTGENVSLWLTEDYAGQVRETFDEMVKVGIVNKSSLANMIIILEEPPQLAKREHGVFKANYEEIGKIAKTMLADGTTLAVFDPLLAFLSLIHI